MDERSNEEIRRAYFYTKGALDYRTKILDIVASLPGTPENIAAVSAILNTFPDDYPGQ